MLSSTNLPLLGLLALSPLAALARTDLSGCTTFTSTVTVNPTAHEYGNIYESLVYYDPDTLEICTVPDCGGGRAPPRTGVPGCPLYSGTATATPSFLPADPLAPPAATTTTTLASSSSGVVAAETITSAASVTTSSSLSGSTTVVVVEGPDGPANVTMVSGDVQPTGSSTIAGGNSTAVATGTPSSSVEPVSGAVSRATVGGLPVALGLAVAFLV